MSDRSRPRDGAAVATNTALALVIAAIAASLVPGAVGLVTYGYVAGGAVLAWRLLRREPVSFIVFVLWLWLLTPAVRRIANFTDGWNPDDPIMAAPGVASIVALRGVVGRRLPTAAAPVVAMVIAVGYGFAIGVLLAGPGAAVAGLLYWLPPPLVGLLAFSDAVDPARLQRAVGYISVAGTAVVSLYGLVQFFWLPGWDEAWMVNSELTTIGLPLPEKVRVFSTLNSPGVLGVVLAAMLVALTGHRSRYALAAAVPGIIVLGLSQVRSGWVGWAAGLAAVLIIGRRVAGRAVVLGLLPLVAVTAFGGAVEATIRDRFDQTAQAGTKDDSLTARIRFHRQILPSVLAHPIGSGVGSTGVASAQASAGAESLGTFDGGIPESLFALGSVVGLAYLAAVAVLACSSVRGARRRGPGAMAAGASVVALAVQVFFGNPLIAGAGVFLAVFAAAALRPNAPPSRGAKGSDLPAKIAG